jgi:hypothetical protein
VRLPLFTSAHAFADDLDREGIALFLACDVGQARDVLGRAEGDRPAIPTYATVQAAVEAAK